MATDDGENFVQVNAKVPESVRDTAKDKLDHGGLSREIRDRLEEIAFGADVNQRSRLERRRDELTVELRERREERREIDAEIETLEQRVEAVDTKLSNITTREDKYEAKLEELENRLRYDAVRVFPSMPAVERMAAAVGKEPEGVIEDLKERNPDVPDFAFREALHDDEELLPMDEAVAAQEPGERERRFR